MAFDFEKLLTEVIKGIYAYYDSTGTMTNNTNLDGRKIEKGSSRKQQEHNVKGLYGTNYEQKCLKYVVYHGKYNLLKL